MCSSGCTVSPPMTSICLRAGWTKGGVKDKYLHFEKAGDQFVGRCVSGLDVLSAEFAVSPAFFEFTNAKDQEEVKNLIETCCDDISPCTAQVVSFCIASLYFHFEYLRDNLPRENLLWSCCIMMDRNVAVSNMVRIAYPWEHCDVCVRLTGIPPHVMILAQMERVLRSQETMPQQIMKTIIEQLDERDVSIGLSMNSIKELFETSHSRLENRLSAFIDNRNNGGSNNVERRQSNRVQIHSYGGKFHLLPEGYSFPRMSLQAMLNHWFLPDFNDNVPAFRILKGGDVVSVKRGRQNINEMKNLVVMVEKVARDKGVWIEDQSMWDAELVSIMYYGIMDKFKIPDAKRCEQFSWATIYKHFIRNAANVGADV